MTTTAQDIITALAGMTPYGEDFDVDDACDTLNALIYTAQGITGKACPSQVCATCAHCTRWEHRPEVAECDIDQTTGSLEDTCDKWTAID